MSTEATLSPVLELPVLLRGETEPIRMWTELWNTRRVVICVGIIIAGTGLFGATVGWWRAPLQAFYTAVKLPLILLLTTLGNALLNGMLAPLLGLNLRFRQSLLAILMSFTIAAAILGAFSPLLFFLVWNSPPMSDVGAGRDTAYRLLLVTQAAVIAFAGIAANLRLMQLLHHLSSNRVVARRVLFAWLAGNLLLGSQLSWILRPFVGSPGLPLEFLRPNAFQGNFYEAIFLSLKHLFTH